MDYKFINKNKSRTQNISFISKNNFKLDLKKAEDSDTTTFNKNTLTFNLGNVNVYSGDNNHYITLEEIPKINNEVINTTWSIFINNNESLSNIKIEKEYDLYQQLLNLNQKLFKITKYKNLITITNLSAEVLNFKFIPDLIELPLYCFDPDLNEVENFKYTPLYISNNTPSYVEYYKFKGIFKNKSFIKYYYNSLEFELAPYSDVIYNGNTHFHLNLDLFNNSKDLNITEYINLFDPKENFLNFTYESPEYQYKFNNSLRFVKYYFHKLYKYQKNNEFVIQNDTLLPYHTKLVMNKDKYYDWLATETYATDTLKSIVEVTDNTIEFWLDSPYNCYKITESDRVYIDTINYPEIKQIEVFINRLNQSFKLDGSLVENEYIKILTDKIFGTCIVNKTNFQIQLTFKSTFTDYPYLNYSTFLPSVIRQGVFFSTVLNPIPKNPPLLSMVTFLNQSSYKKPYNSYGAKVINTPTNTSVNSLSYQVFINNEKVLDNFNPYNNSSVIQLNNIGIKNKQFLIHQSNIFNITNNNLNISFVQNMNNTDQFYTMLFKQHTFIKNNSYQFILKPKHYFYNSFNDLSLYLIPLGTSWKVYIDEVYFTTLRYNKITNQFSKFDLYQKNNTTYSQDNGNLLFKVFGKDNQIIKFVPDNYELYKYGWDDFKLDFKPWKAEGDRVPWQDPVDGSYTLITQELKYKNDVSWYD